MSEALTNVSASPAQDDTAVILRVSRSMSEYCPVIHKINVGKGWHDEERSFGDYIALMHSELSEALEWYRKHGYVGAGKLSYTEKGKPEGIAVELADVIIRIADFCGAYGIPLDEALFVKVMYNKTRDHRHGGKVI